MSCSLIAPQPGDDRQALLFDELPADVRAAVLFREEKGEYTAGRLFSQQPRLYVACVRLLGMEMPVIAIAEALGVSDNTVRLVREREPESIADFQAKQGRRRRTLMTRCLERLDETVGAAEFRDVAVVYGIVADKEALANGTPTAIIASAALPATDAFEAWAREHGVTLDVPMQVKPAESGCGDGGAAPTREGAAEEDRAGETSAEEGPAE